MSDRFFDPIVAEIHAARAAMLEAVGGDIQVLMQQVSDRQCRSNHRVIHEPLRGPKQQMGDDPGHSNLGSRTVSRSC